MLRHHGFSAAGTSVGGFHHVKLEETHDKILSAIATIATVTVTALLSNPVFAQHEHVRGSGHYGSAQDLRRFRGTYNQAPVNEPFLRFLRAWAVWTPIFAPPQAGWKYVSALGFEIAKMASLRFKYAQQHYFRSPARRMKIAGQAPFPGWTFRQNQLPANSQWRINALIPN